MHLADPNSLAWIKHLSNDPEAMNILIIGQLLQYVVSDVSGSRGEIGDRPSQDDADTTTDRAI